jgi:ketosteroid isomerase-like protein
MEDLIMNTLTKIILILLCLSLLSSAQLFGQEWSEQQKEVWAQVEGRWQAWVEGDYNKGMSFISDDWRGWSGIHHAPLTKKTDKPGLERWLQNYKIVLIHLHPFVIDIHDDFATVFYSNQNVTEQKDGSETKNQTKWTEIYRKIDGKWLLISSYFDISLTTN